ncbi:MAG: DUF2867 domain-containing protein [Phycisphaeraceae bacterium]
MRRILVTGATGYIGGRLVPRLIDRGDAVRVLVRDRERVEGRPWEGMVDVAVGDVLDAATLPEALDGIDVAYYLIHAMGSDGDFAERDRRGAEHFGLAAKRAGVKHVIYLGGLQPDDDQRASPHLASRAETGRVLAERVPVTEFRAGPIIGSGSASFEMVRYLTERLPAMVAPKWIRNKVQPIAVRDILAYLLAASEGEPAGVVGVGGEQLTFKDMMHGYASVRGFKRLIVPVPVLAPKLAARWVGFVTPIPNRLAVPLIEGVVQPLLVKDDKAKRLFPEVEPIGYQESVALALGKIELGDIETRWSGSFGVGESLELKDSKGIVRERRRVRADCSAEALFRSFTSLGGERGYMTFNWAWRLRGAMDALIGGPGLRRGRRHPDELLPGEAMDFWRVEEVEPYERLTLRAEMKLPGEAWLRWEVCPDDDSGDIYLEQTAAFRPRGLPGLLYWWSLYPIHLVMFTRMARAIAARGKTLEHAESTNHHAAHASTQTAEKGPTV